MKLGQPTHVKLLTPVDIGSKIVPAGRVVSFNRAFMDKLVNSNKAFYCTRQGLRVGPPPERVSIDEEE
jgi:hypothetical protein